MSLQFKLAQEKTTKTIKSTASSISASIKSFSQDLFSRKIDPVVMNAGYKEFITRYEEDMKHIEESMKALASASTQVTEEWKKSEEEQQKRIAELQEENKALREEKTTLEASLRSTIQSLELANEEAKGELLKARVEFKVSVRAEWRRDSQDQEENNRRLKKLEEKVAEVETVKEQEVKAKQAEVEAAKQEAEEAKEEAAKQSARAETAESRVKALENVDKEQQAEEEKKRVVEAGTARSTDA